MSWIKKADEIDDEELSTLREDFFACYKTIGQIIEIGKPPKNPFDKFLINVEQADAIEEKCTHLLEIANRIAGLTDRRLFQ